MIIGHVLFHFCHAFWLKVAVIILVSLNNWLFSRTVACFCLQCWSVAPWKYYYLCLIFHRPFLIYHYLHLFFSFLSACFPSQHFNLKFEHVCFKGCHLFNKVFQLNHVMGIFFFRMVPTQFSKFTISKGTERDAVFFNVIQGMTLPHNLCSWIFPGNVA